MDSTVQRRDESDLADEYFNLYRDTDRDKRSLRALCGRIVCRTGILIVLGIS